MSETGETVVRDSGAVGSPKRGSEIDPKVAIAFFVAVVAVYGLIGYGIYVTLTLV